MEGIICSQIKWHLGLYRRSKCVGTERTGTQLLLQQSWENPYSDVDYGQVEEGKLVCGWGNLFCLQIFRKFINTAGSFKVLLHSFSVLLWMWQSVCSSYCSQLNAVSFSTALHAALYRSIYSLLTGSALGTLQGFIVCYCECGSQSVPVIAVSWMLSVSAQHYMLHCTDP
jgi:hypothetical protein